MDSNESNQATRGRGKNKRIWTTEEDRVLIQLLQEIATDPRFKQDNTWKNGYLIRAEELISQKLPLRGIKANPHIDSRWKTLKGKYYAIAKMLNKSRFGWDDTKKMIQCEKSVYVEYCKNHKDARGLWNISFPFFDEIGDLIGKDRATGKDVETFDDAIENMENELVNEINTIEDDNEEDDGISVTQLTAHSAFKRTRKRSTPKTKEAKEYEDPHIVAFHNVSSNMNKFMENMNTHLATMANTWSRA